MRLLYLLSVIALGCAAWLGVSANDSFDSAASARSNNETLRADGEKLVAEAKSLVGLQPSPLLYENDALSEFVHSTLEAGEVLGAGVRVEPRDEQTGNTQMTFAPLHEGVDRCQVTIEAAMDGAEAPAVLAMIEDEMSNLPVTVTKIAAHKESSDMAVSMDVDVFGRPQ